MCDMTQVVVWVSDELGQGLEGKSVYLWVKPDSSDFVDERCEFVCVCLCVCGCVGV